MLGHIYFTITSSNTIFQDENNLVIKYSYQLRCCFTPNKKSSGWKKPSNKWSLLLTKKIHEELCFEWAHISSNMSFIEHENLKLGHTLSSRKMNFSSISLTITKSLPSLVSNISSFSSFNEFKFLKNTNHRTRISLRLKEK